MKKWHFWDLRQFLDSGSCDFLFNLACRFILLSVGGVNLAYLHFDHLWGFLFQIFGHRPGFSLFLSIFALSLFVWGLDSRLFWSFNVSNVERHNMLSLLLNLEQKVQNKLTLCKIKTELARFERLEAVQAPLDNCWGRENVKLVEFFDESDHLVSNLEQILFMVVLCRQHIKVEIFENACNSTFLSFLVVSILLSKNVSDFFDSDTEMLQWATTKFG